MLKVERRQPTLGMLPSSWFKWMTDPSRKEAKKISTISYVAGITNDK